MWTIRHLLSRLNFCLPAALLAVGLYGHAYAQTVTKLTNTGSAALFSYDGLQFAVSGCTSNAAAGSSAACGAVEMTAVSQGRGSVAIEFLGNGGIYGSNALSVAAGGSNSTTSFVLTVTSLGTSKLTGVSAAVVSNPSNINYVSVPFQVNASGCTITAGSAYPGGGNCEPYSGGSTNAAVAFTATSSLSIDYNLSVNAQSGQADVLSSTTATFSKIPEPGSIAAMGSGLLFLGFIQARRRQARRSGQAASRLT